MVVSNSLICQSRFHGSALAKSDLVFRADVVEDLLKSRLQRGQTGISAEGQPVILNFAPQDLEPIQLRAVRWQEMHPDPLRQPALETVRYGLAVVNWGIVQDHQSEVVRAHGSDMIERREDLRAPDPSGMGIQIRFIRPIEQAQHIQPLPTATRQFVSHPRRLPGIRYARDQIKPGGIKVKQVDLATGLGRPQPR